MSSLRSSLLRRPPGVLVGVLVLTALGPCVLLNGCGGGTARGVPTPFFADFSLAEHLDRDDPALVPGGGIAVGRQGIDSSVDGHTFHQASHTADLHVPVGAEEDLHRRLHDAVLQAIEDRGLRILVTDGGVSALHLVVGYAGEDAHGWLDLRGVRRDGDAYRLLAVLTESSLGAPEARH